MKKQKFDTEICVRCMEDRRVNYLAVVGRPNDPHGIDASDGDAVAVYGLLRVQTYRTNPRLDK